MKGLFMFIEINDGFFIAVDTIASVQRTAPTIKEHLARQLPTYLVITKRGEHYVVSGEAYDNLNQALVTLLVK